MIDDLDRVLSVLQNSAEMLASDLGIAKYALVLRRENFVKRDPMVCRTFESPVNSDGGLFF